MGIKKIVFLLLTGCFIMLAGPVAAQKDDDYKVHTIKKGEIISVLAKKYGVTVEDLIKLNKFGPNPVLHVGQKVKLPANAVLQEATDSTQTTLVPLPVEEKQQPAKPLIDTLTPARPAAPVVHVVQKGEVLSVLAKKYNVSVADIIKINKFGPNPVMHVGDKVKIPAAAAVQKAPVTAAPVADVVTEKPVLKKDTAAVTQASLNPVTHIVKPKETLYAISKQYKVLIDQIKTWNHLKDNSISTGQKLLIYTSVITVPPPPAAKTDTLVKEETVAEQPQQKIVAPPVVTASPAAKVVTAKKDAVPVVQQKPATPVADANVPASGFFSGSFGKDVAGRTLQTTNGEAMTFKTASGWNDKKYYILMNDVPPGSIVQITNADGKAIYAKILWNMGDIKDNEGLNFRISDAAAAALNLKDMKFPLTVTYYQ